MMMATQHGTSKISKRVMERTRRSAIARFAAQTNPTQSTTTVKEAHATRLLDTRNPFQSVYLSETEMLVDLKKSRDPHYPYRAIVYTDKGEWERDIPLAATAQLSIIR